MSSAASSTPECCPSASWPALQRPEDYKEKGQERALASGLSLYDAAPEPDEKGAALIVIYDVFGSHGGRTRAIVDQLAQCGFRTVLPDFFDGKSIEDFGGFTTPEGQAFLKSQGWDSVGPKLKEVLDDLFAQGYSRIGLLGFCYGGHIVMHAAADDKIAAASICHPSTKLAGLIYGEDELAIAGAVKVPVQLLPAGNDPDNLKTDGAVVQAVRTTAGQQCETNEFKDMSHGWVSRGDIDVPEVKRDVERALSLVCDFFKRTLAQPEP